MRDLFFELREARRNQLSANLKDIVRNVGVDKRKFYEMAGISDTEYQVLESGETMNITQYLACCSVLDVLMARNPHTNKHINALLNREAEDASLIDEWCMMFERVSNFIEEDSDYLYDLAHNYRVIICRDSLEVAKKDETFKQLTKEMESAGNMLIVPELILEEIQKDVTAVKREAREIANATLALLNKKDYINFNVLDKEMQIENIVDEIELIILKNKDFPTALIIQDIGLGKKIKEMVYEKYAIDIKVISLMKSPTPKSNSILAPQEEDEFFEKESEYVKYHSDDIVETATVEKIPEGSTGDTTDDMTDCDDESKLYSSWDSL